MTEKPTSVRTHESAVLGKDGKSTRILVCGSREWSVRETIHQELSRFSGNVVLIHGGARGADTIAGEVAQQLTFEVVSCPADRARYGKAAGPIRNKQMLDQHHPDLVLAFVREDSRSAGTRHMIETARKAAVEVRVIEQSADNSRWV